MFSVNAKQSPNRNVPLRGVASSDAAERDVAIWALLSVDAEHADRRLVVPSLVKALADTNFVIRLVAARGLGLFGTNAQPAVPVLVRLLNDRNSRVRPDATNALRKIDPEAAARAGVKPQE
jgi:HEAT repeat protein